MTTFLALYRGKTISEARVIAVSADPELVALIVTALVKEPESPETDDPVTTTLAHGRRAALRLIQQETDHDPAA